MKELHVKLFQEESNFINKKALDVNANIDIHSLLVQEYFIVVTFFNWEKVVNNGQLILFFVSISIRSRHFSLGLEK